MPSDTALDDLNAALDELESAVEIAAERRNEAAAGREEVQRLNADRAALAAELDVSEDRVKRLSDANGEVSRRLVSAMETVRAVLDRA